MSVDDVIVIGAGPAGSYAAYRLAKAGLRVRLLEEHTVVGEPRHCTGVLGREAFDRFPELTRDMIQAELKAAWIVSPSGERVRTEWYEGQAYVINRTRFDQTLSDMAVHAGAQLHCSTSAYAIHVDSQGVNVQALEAGHEVTWQAQSVILATGISYRLQTQVGLQAPASHLYCAQMELDGPEIKETEVYIGKQWAPGSFAWAVPLGNGRVRVGVTAHRLASGYLEALLDSPRLRGRVQRRQEEPRKRPVPIRSLPMSVADRVLTVGDAAGQVKPTTGGGIYYGLIGASLAAETLLEGFRLRRWDRSFLKSYDRAWKAELKKEMRIGGWSRKIFEHLSDAQLDRLVRICRHPKISEAISQHALFDWHGKTVLSFLLSPRVFSQLFG